MSEDIVVRHCAPTLAGLKTGNIFTTSYESDQRLDEDIRELNLILAEKGIKIIKLRSRCGRALIYVYRPGKLQTDLSREEARRILAGFGYVETDQECCIDKLIERIDMEEGFPHEIGLFLGYPPEDVSGFINCGGKECKSCGYWKVYGDVDAAEKLFAMYAKCTGVYLKCLEKGVTLSKLAVKKNEWRNQS